jgi:hypothetical protein
MVLSLVSRPFKHASGERGEDEMTISRQSARDVYNGAPATFRRVAEQASGIEPAVTERDTKRIIRQWNREIEDETRRLAERAKDEGRWRLVVWTGLWFLWLGVLLGLIGLIRPLH